MSRANSQPSTSTAGFCGELGPLPAGFPDFGGDGVHVGAGHRRIHCSHVHHASGLDAVQPNVAADRRGVVKLKDEFAVGGSRVLFCSSSLSLAVGGKLGDLPLLALVFAQVLHDEGLHIGDAEQALARGVDGEASEVAGDPAAVEFFGNGGGGAASNKAVQNQIVFH
jgi:hypothetical protein